MDSNVVIRRVSVPTLVKVIDQIRYNPAKEMAWHRGKIISPTLPTIKS